MVNLGKGIENDKKWNEEKLVPFMNVLINTLPWIGFIQNNDFKKEQILKKYKLEKWPIGRNRKMIKKWPMLNANSVLRAKNKANADQVLLN